MEGRHTPYTAEGPALERTFDQLREQIPGWGVDADPKDRPSVPRERGAPAGTGAHWTFPDRQPEGWPRERSIEHGMLTPVFGTSCPPKGLSGVIRRAAYRRYSEARAAHWLLLLAADRVDALESRCTSLLRGRPDPVLPTGLRSELTHHGVGSRVGRNRADLAHQALDPVVIAGPAVAVGLMVARGAVGVARRRRAGARAAG